MNNYCIYCHTNKINGKKYIGQTCQLLSQRWGHNGKGYQTSTVFYKAIQKYGWDNFEHEILKSNLTLEEANYWEEYYIKFYHTWVDDPQCNGYNIHTGGGNHKDPEYIRKIKSENAKGEKNYFYGKHFFGEDNPFYGKKHTNESKQKMSIKIKCNETGEIFNSLDAASKYAGLASSSSISLCCRGKRKHAGRHPITKEQLSWTYIDSPREAKE